MKLPQSQKKKGGGVLQCLLSVAVSFKTFLFVRGGFFLRSHKDDLLKINKNKWASDSECGRRGVFKDNLGLQRRQ